MCGIERPARVRGARFDMGAKAHTMAAVLVRLVPSLVRSSIAIALLSSCTPGSNGSARRAEPPPGADAGSAAALEVRDAEPPFVYSVESFADLRILRYR